MLGAVGIDVEEVSQLDLDPEVFDQDGLDHVAAEAVGDAVGDAGAEPEGAEPHGAPDPEGTGIDVEPGPRALRWRVPAAIVTAGVVAIVAAWWTFASGGGGPAPLSAAQWRQAAKAAGIAGSSVLSANPRADVTPIAPPVVSTSPPTVATPAPTSPAPSSTSKGTSPAASASASPPATALTAPAVAGIGGAAVPAEVAQVAYQIIAAVNRQSNGRLVVPATDQNVALLAQWMANEGGLWADNPLNTSLDAGRYPHQFTSDGEDTGIPIFPSMAAGVDATAKTLLSGPAYRRILLALTTGKASCPAFAADVIHSPWASSHYHYNTAAFCGASPGAALNTGTRGGGHRGVGHGAGHGAGHGTGHGNGQGKGTGKGAGKGSGARQGGHKPAGHAGTAHPTTTAP